MTQPPQINEKPTVLLHLSSFLSIVSGMPQKTKLHGIATHVSDTEDIHGEIFLYISPKNMRLTKLTLYQHWAS